VTALQGGRSKQITRAVVVDGTSILTHDIEDWPSQSNLKRSGFPLRLSGMSGPGRVIRANAARRLLSERSGLASAACINNLVPLSVHA
jgi:hypothetical protein